jgi:hypothetical protein
MDLFVFKAIQVPPVVSDCFLSGVGKLPPQYLLVLNLVTFTLQLMTVRPMHLLAVIVMQPVEVMITQAELYWRQQQMGRVLRRSG